MGMMKKRVRVCNSKAPERSFEEQFWVDTGALYSFVSEEVDPVYNRLKPILAVIGGFIGSA